ncbi:MAG: hypothetical protein FWC00_00320 [Firmicutes bacterium]|nr:hypothetical protein [Bacillota bacterium]
MIAKITDDKTIVVYDKSQFDWYAIRNSGQIFVDPPCVVTEESNKIVIKATGKKDSRWLFDFFDLGTDYNAIKKDLAGFGLLCDAMKFGFGIRILKQPFVSCAISFIISANNNIKRFAKTIEQIDFDDLEKYTVEDFARMGCGYRAPYLYNAVRQLKSMSFEELKTFDNARLRKTLMSISGVGPKVADCIMLFAFHRLDVAPVDTWIARANLPQTIMGHRYAGVAQQYVFYYLQHLKKSLK